MSENENRSTMSWGWILAATIMWPTFHVAVFTFRFGEIPASDALSDLLLFMPTGFLGSLIVGDLVRRSRSRAQGRLVMVCTVLALPVAFMGNLLGGLLGPIGVTLYGVVPIILGAGAGWLLGMSLTDRDAPTGGIDGTTGA